MGWSAANKKFTDFLFRSSEFVVLRFDFDEVSVPEARLSLEFFQVVATLSKNFVLAGNLGFSVGLA